jgi:hypothetical protein
VNAYTELWIFQSEDPLGKMGGISADQTIWVETSNLLDFTSAVAIFGTAWFGRALTMASSSNRCIDARGGRVLFHLLEVLVMRRASILFCVLCAVLVSTHVYGADIVWVTEDTGPEFDMSAQNLLTDAGYKRHPNGQCGRFARHECHRVQGDGGSGPGNSQP